MTGDWRAPGWSRDEPVVMLDLVDLTLHLPASGKHLRTRCGLPLGKTTVGPFRAVHERAARLCPECFALPVEP